MRECKKRGKIARKKMMSKLQTNEARAIENESIAKCFTTVVIEEEGNYKRRYIMYWWKFDTEMRDIIFYGIRKN
jgi:hypothetical protein